MIYLAEKCPRFAHSMYPKCVKTRAIIHQRLFHDSSSFYIRILDIANLAFSSTANPVITVQHRDNLNKALSVLEVRAGMPETIIHPQVLWSAYLQSFLEGFEYFAGNQITIADLSYLASMTTLIVSWDDIPPFLIQKHSMAIWIILCFLSTGSILDLTSRRISMWTVGIREWQKFLASKNAMLALGNLGLLSQREFQTLLINYELMSGFDAFVFGAALVSNNKF